MMQPEPATTAARVTSRPGIAAIVIMAAGFGWVGGNFATSTDTLPAQAAITLGHLIFPVALALLAAQLTTTPAPPAAPRGVTAVAWLSVLFAAVSTSYALANPNPNAFGPHNLADYTAIVILLAGAVLWLLQRFIPLTAAAQPGRNTTDHPPTAQREPAN